MTTTEQLQLSIPLEQLRKVNRQMSHRIVGLESKVSHLEIFLKKFLDEFEAQFDSDERCASDEIAVDYIVAARWMKENCGRDDGKRIEYVQDWIDLLPSEKQYKS